jgi:hypothetical protein
LRNHLRHHHFASVNRRIVGYDGFYVF